MIEQAEIDAIVSGVMRAVRKEIEPVQTRLDAFADRIKAAEDGLNETNVAAIATVQTLALKGDAIAFTEQLADAMKEFNATLPDIIARQASEIVTASAPGIIKTAQEQFDDVIATLIEKSVAKSVAAIELPEPIPGEPGKDAPTIEVLADDEGVTLSFSDGREVKLKHGIDGAPGGSPLVTECAEGVKILDGEREFVIKHGKDGIDGVSPELPAFEVPQDGAPGVGIAEIDTTPFGVTVRMTDGKSFEVKHGIDGVSPELPAFDIPKDGKDGDGIKSIEDTEEGIILHFTNGDTSTIKHGKPGADGVGIAEIEEHDDHGILKFTDGRTLTILDGKPGTDGVGATGVIDVSDDGKAVTVTLSDGNAFEVKHGTDGTNGADGVGIADVVVNADFHAALVLTDGTTKGLGRLKGEPGADGVGLAGAFIDRAGELVVTLTNGVAKSLGPVVGADGVTPTVDLELLKGKDGIDGIDGTNGVDGVGFDEFTVEHDGGRTIELKFTRGDEVKSFPLTLPTMIYRGFYKPGAYDAGDVVSWAGSLWACKSATEDKPDPSPNWELAARKGRDGLSVKGDKGEPGKAGKPGKDLTQLGHDGRKW